jgi:hypothetical protein
MMSLGGESVRGGSEGGSRAEEVMMPSRGRDVTISCDVRFRTSAAFVLA